MNTLKNRFFGLALVGLMLGGCSQMATFEDADLMNEQAVANKVGFTMNPFNVGGNENAAISNSGNFSLTYESSVCFGTESIATFGGVGFTGTRTVQIQKETSPGVWVQVFQQSQAPSGTSGSLGVLSVGVHKFRWSVSGQSGPNNVVFNITVEQCGCDIDGNEFSGVPNSCAQNEREAVYTFGSEDGVGYFKMQGGLNNFTGGNASVYINGTLVNFNSTSSDGWATGTVDGFTVGQRTPGQSSNRNIRVEGGLGECSEVVVKIVWNSSNAGSTITGEWTVVDNGGAPLADPVDGLSCS
jgi:hypothetical protein